MIDDKDLNKIIKTLNQEITSGKITRTALLSVHQLTAKRIFQDGINAKGGLIGLYSKNTLSIRKKKNYPQSKKIILQATGRMVNDYSLVEDGKEFGSGFKQARNSELSDDLEKRFGKIWELTESEKKKIPVAFDDAIKQVLR